VESKVGGGWRQLLAGLVALRWPSVSPPLVQMVVAKCPKVVDALYSRREIGKESSSISQFFLARKIYQSCIYEQKWIYM
jgi:hypothetical protein